MGAWIETALRLCLSVQSRVAPYVGAWIETPRSPRKLKTKQVAPYVGAWIETTKLEKIKKFLESHPTWVRGLKLADEDATLRVLVAPYVSAWIETFYI